MTDTVQKMALRRDATKSQADAQLQLVHEDVNDLAKALVAALGGTKVVGPLLFPQKSADNAARYLADCLNPNRDHDMGIERFLLLLKMAREGREGKGGIHFGIEWIADELGYSRPMPIEPEDARAALQRQFLAGVEDLKQLAKRLER